MEFLGRPNPPSWLNSLRYSPDRNIKGPEALCSAVKLSFSDNSDGFLIVIFNRLAFDDNLI